MSGRVYLVGAGPGHPGLLTLRGRDLLATADVVFYDALVNPRLLDLTRPEARRVLVGKRHGRVTIAQEEIEALMIESALAGNAVVRLKGGDPFVFGRGGEEAAACRRAEVPFEVVPGVTAAIAVPAFAGIPVTHRRHASVVTFVTGRPGEGKDENDPDWAALAHTEGTLVLLMAMTRIGEIAGKLLEAGMSPSTPAAAIRWGTLPRQTTVRASLAEITAKTEEAGLRPPVVFVLGEVASDDLGLGWYEDLPLFGRRIVVTRARHQAAEFTSLLEAAGAWVLEYPTIEITELDVPEDALDRASRADWLVLTSVNGVERFFDAYLGSGRDIRELAGVKIAAIGPATAASVEKRGVQVAARPAEYRGEALLEALGEVDGLTVVLARAEVAREVLPRELAERGADVEVVPVYRTVIPEVEAAAAELSDVDMVTFTSSSTVRNFDRLNSGRGKEILSETAVAAIGPITEATLREIGVAPDVVADSYTIADLTTAIIDYFANRRSLK